MDCKVIETVGEAKQRSNQSRNSDDVAFSVFNFTFLFF